MEKLGSRTLSGLLEILQGALSSVKTCSPVLLSVHHLGCQALPPSRHGLKQKSAMADSEPTED